ncbi:MAG: NAD(P)H-dependent amine dehydrogenase family protein [Nitrososphaerales archaeon]
MPRYKAVSFGLGPIGASIAKLAFERNDEVELIGAVDIDPKLLGKDIGEIAGLGRNTGIKVEKTGSDLYKDADIVLHAASSFIKVARPEFLEFCENKLDVVSTNEELSYPWYSHREIAAELDRAAKKNQTTILGTGVNPGFVMDFLPIALSGACSRIKCIEVTRILDATNRRVPFQKKVGIGMSVLQFEDNVRTGSFGHIGIVESIAIVCTALGQEIDCIDQNISPKLATQTVETDHFGTVKEGNVIGLVQDATAYSRGNQIAKYHIEMYAGAAEPRDEIILRGEPDMTMIIPGGTPGDSATAAIIVNSIARVAEAAPGLLTVKDLRPATSIIL